MAVTPPASLRSTHEEGAHLSSAVGALLGQLADTPGCPGSPLGFVSGILQPLTGWPTAEFLTRLLADLTAPANLPTIERAMLRQPGGDFTPFIVTLRGRSGPVHVQVAARPVGDTGVIAAVVTALPGTLQTGDLRGERSRLLNLLDRLPGYVVLLGPDHVIRYENRAFRQLFGPGVGKACHEVLRHSPVPCQHCPPCEVFETHTLCISDWARPDGSAFRVYAYPFEDVDGTRLVLKLGIDITAGVKALEALSRSEERYRSITDNLAQGVAVLDPALRIEAVNPRMSSWFGADVCGEPLCRLLHDYCGDGNTHCAGCPAIDVFRDGAPHQRSILLRLPGQHEQRNFRLQACPIRTPGQASDAAVIMLEDETDRLRVERQLAQARRLEALGTLATGVAHEINQPLSALRLYASGLEMLVEKRPVMDREMLLERLGRILREADRIHSIIEHMRGLVTHGDIRCRPTSVARACHETLGLVGVQLRSHGIDACIDLHPDLPDVLAVPVQLEQALINLLINAMHALDTSPRQDKYIRLSGVSQGDVVKLTVEDNGPGLGDLGDRVFDPFFTTKDAHAGMGLGLALVHGFVEAWGGSVAAATVPYPGHGALFTITLLAAPTTSAAPAPTGSAGAPGAPGAPGSPGSAGRSGEPGKPGMQDRPGIPPTPDVPCPCRALDQPEPSEAPPPESPDAP